jgi:tetraacyldisaccharide 4'-kinase
VHPSEVWFGSSLGARATRLALVPASWLYTLGWRAYAQTYRFGFKKSAEPHVPVVCVGNLVVGGTGKTPTTMAVAAILRSMRYRVVLSLSGYGAPRNEGATFAPEGPLEAKEWGDEAAMIRWLMPELPLVVGRKRVQAAEIVNARFPDAVMLMDDGFQHLPLKKHITLLLDSNDPPNQQCLPAGPYREPRASRRLASTVLPGEFRIMPQATQFRTPAGQDAEPFEQYQVLCALGDPAAFVASLENVRKRPAECVSIQNDHDPLDAGSLWDRLGGDSPIVVSAKDWVKLRQRADIDQKSIIVAHRTVQIEPEAEFRAWLKARLDGISTTSP